MLIQYGADVNAANWKERTALHRGHHVEFAKVLIQNGADVNADVEGRSVLCEAASRERVAYSLQLLCFGARDQRNAINLDKTGLLVPINDSLKSLRAGNGMKVCLMSDDERRFMWNLAFSFTIAHR